MRSTKGGGWQWLAIRVGLALAGGASLRAQSPPSPAAPPSAILFVGNSFLHCKYLPLRRYNAENIKDENFGLPLSDPRGEKAESGPYGGIPGIFKKFTDEAGVPYDVHVEAVSAKPLEYHYEHALPVIAQAKWDAVVLQDYSTGPLPTARGGKPERFLKNAALLEQAVHAANPHARMYLYETWPRADLIHGAKAPYAGESVDAMASDLHDAYYRAFAENGHFEGVAPIGDAWQAAIHAGLAQADPYRTEQDDKIDLWGEDDYHPSAEGAYLAALACFQQITGKDARSLGAGERAAADLGIAAEDAVKLQEIAASQVAAAMAKPPLRRP